MRITPDTGILVRMNVRATGPARHLLDVILDGPHELVLSEFLLQETARVLRYPRMQAIYNLSYSEYDAATAASPASCAERLSPFSF